MWARVEYVALTKQDILEFSGEVMSPCDSASYVHERTRAERRVETLSTALPFKLDCHPTVRPPPAAHLDWLDSLYGHDFSVNLSQCYEDFMYTTYYVFSRERSRFIIKDSKKLL